MIMFFILKIVVIGILVAYFGGIVFTLLSHLPAQANLFSKGGDKK